MVLKVRNQNVCFCVSQAIKLLDMLNCPWSNFDGYAWTRTCALRKRWTAPGAWTEVSDALFWSEIAEQASHRFPNNYVFVFFFPRDLQHNFFSLSVFSGWSFWSPRIVFWVFFICLGFEFFVPSCHAASSDRVSIDNKPFDVSFMLTLCCCFWFLLLLEKAHFCLAWDQLKFSGCALKRTWLVPSNLL